MIVFRGASFSTYSSHPGIFLKIYDVQENIHAQWFLSTFSERQWGLNLLNTSHVVTDVHISVRIFVRNFMIRSHYYLQAPAQIRQYPSILYSEFGKRFIL